MTEDGKNTIHLSQNEYKEFVANCIKRIIKEGCFSVQVLEKKGEFGADVKINFNKPEWFKQLDSTAQDIIFHNFHDYITKCLTDK